MPVCACVPEDSSSLSPRADRIPMSSIVAVQRIPSVSHRERQCPLIQLQTRARTVEDATDVCMCEGLGGRKEIQVYFRRQSEALCGALR